MNAPVNSPAPDDATPAGGPPAGPMAARRRLVVALAVVGVLAVGLVAAVLVANREGETVASTPGVLFSLEAPSSRIDQTLDSMTIQVDRDERVTWFTSRPEHRGGTMPLARFVETWEEMGFDTDPPNAALVVRDGDVVKTHVVELTGATMDDSVVVFDLGESVESMHGGHKASHPLEVGPLAATEMFIDSVACASTCVSVNNTLTPRVAPTTTTTTPPPPPSQADVTSVSPSTAAAGDGIVISGVRLDSVEDVAINGMSVEAFTIESSTEIHTVVPPGASTGAVTVSSPKGSWSAASLTVTSPALTSFTPTTATAGTAITVNGANLGDTTAVRIGGEDVTWAVVSSTQLRVTVGANSVTGQISITTARGKATSTTALTVTSPAITGFTPPAGAPGTSVAVDGANLTGTKTVTIGGVAAQITAQSATRVTVKVPSGVASGPIRITATAGTATSTDPFIRGAQVDSITPTTAAAGATVTLTGSGLTGTTAVEFAGSHDSADFTVVNDTTVTAVVPADAITGGVGVIAATTATSPSLTVTPTLTELVPATGPIGTVVTASGTALGNVSTIRVGATSVAVTKVSSTQVRFTVPSAAPGAVTVTLTSGSTTVSAPFTVTPASSAAVNPVTFTPSGLTSIPSGGLPDPITVPSLTLAPGLTLTSLSGSASGGTYTGTGTAIAGSFTFPASITRTSPFDWVLRPTGDGSAQINGRGITVRSMTGALTTVGGMSTWGITGSLSARTTLVDTTVAILGADVAFVATCPLKPTDGFCTKGSGAPFLRIDGAGTGGKGLEIRVGTGIPDQASAPFTSALNLGSGAYVLSGALPADAKGSWAGGAVNLTGAHLRLAYGDDTWASSKGPVTVPAGSSNNGFAVQVRGTGHITVSGVRSWNLTTLTATYLNGGAVVSGSVTVPTKTGPAFVTDVAYVEVQPSVTAQILDSTVIVDSRTFVLTGSASTPKWLKDKVGLPDADMGAYITYTTGGLARFTGVIPTGLKLPPVPYVSASFDRLLLQASVNWEAPTTGYAYSLSAQGTMQINGQEPFGVALQGTFESHNGTPQVSLSVSAYGQNGRALWPDVFGVDGFDLNAFSLQVGITPAFPFLTVGIAGDGTLPSKLREYMGINSRNDIPVRFVADISETNPCLEVSVGDPGSSTDILAMPPGVGALTATYASMQVSAVGCTVGMFEVPAGVRVKFDGKVFGAKVDGFAAYNPEPGGPPGLKTPSIFVWAKVDGNQPGPGIDVDAKIHVSAGGWNPVPSFQVRGGIKIDKNNRIAVSGDCQVTSKGPDCNASGTGKMDLGVVQVDIELRARHWLSPAASFEGSGEVDFAGMKIKVEGTFAAGGRYGSVTLPSWSFTGTLDFPRKSLVDRISIGFGQKAGAPFGSAELSGDLGGTFKKLTGESGRFDLKGDFATSLPSYKGSTDLRIELGSVKFDVILGIDVCMSGPCAGRITPTVAIKNYKGFDLSKSPIPLNPDDWSFDAVVSGSYSTTGQVGDDWGGVKGTFSVNGSLEISSKGRFSLKVSASAKGYLGAAGSWTYLGTYKVDVNLDKPEFCVTASGTKVCV